MKKGKSQKQITQDELTEALRKHLKKKKVNLSQTEIEHIIYWSMIELKSRTLTLRTKVCEIQKELDEYRLKRFYK